MPSDLNIGTSVSEYYLTLEGIGNTFELNSEFFKISPNLKNYSIFKLKPF